MTSSISFLINSLIRSWYAFGILFSSSFSLTTIELFHLPWPLGALQLLQTASTRLARIQSGGVSHAYLSSTPMDFCGVFRNDFETMFRYDIDILINRTMVYGSLTIVLALIYAGLIIGLQTLLSSVTGGSNLAIVASTLVIAALFQPLRKRVQDLIDRRFYRRRTKLDFSRSKWYDD